MKEKVKGTMFSNKMLVKMIVPLVLEQLLGIFVGMADTIMVSSVGEEAVSAVSLVDMLNVLFFTVFSALATGGSVVVAHYIGKKDNEDASHAGNQLFRSTLLVGVIVMVICLVGNRFLLRLIFNDIEADVMDGAVTYFTIIAFSLPFMACYNACVSLFRVMGNSKVSLYCSFAMNICNIIGNAILLYGFHMGVAGVAIASTVSRIGSMIILVRLLRKPKNPVQLSGFSLKLDFSMVKRILNIGIPNGLENGIFQIGKLLVTSLVSGFGTASIAANAVGGTVASFQNIGGSAIGVVMITVVGQCIGAGEYEQTKYYVNKLMKISYIGIIGSNILTMLCVVPFVDNLFHLSPGTTGLAQTVLIITAIGSSLVWPISFTLPNALRAAGDVKSTMVISILSMWIWRVLLSYILGKYLGFGLPGVWFAMVVDWACRGICFMMRFRSGKWKEQKVT